VTGPTEAETAASGSADYPEGPLPAARPLPLRVPAVDHQDSFVHTLATTSASHDAEVTTLRAGFPAALLDEIGPGPGRALAGTTSGGLQLR